MSAPLWLWSDWMTTCEAFSFPPVALSTALRMSTSPYGPSLVAANHPWVSMSAIANPSSPSEAAKARTCVPSPRIPVAARPSDTGGEAIP